MGNDLFLSKIESNDEILEGNAVDSFVYYTTAYRKQIDKYFMLKDVLESVFITIEQPKLIRNIRV